MSTNVGDRIAEERERLGKTQTEFAAAAGVGRASQQNYEAGRRYPDAEYLEAIALLGADVQYILTGVRSTNLLEVAEETRSYKKPAPAERKEVDQSVLSGVLAGVNEYLSEHKLKMPPDAHAELVMLLCDFFTAETAQDTPAVKQAVAKIIQLRGGRP